MMMLAIRTDKPEAELYLVKDDAVLAELKWEAHRHLGETLHKKTEELLSLQGASLQNVEKIAVFEGPGSFTGLRIGISVANALGFALGAPVVQAGGDDWLNICMQKTDSTSSIALPVYGSQPHITQQKKIIREQMRKK